MKFISLHRNFMKNFIRGLCLSFFVFLIAPLLTFASTNLTVVSIARRDTNYYYITSLISPINYDKFSLTITSQLDYNSYGSFWLIGFDSGSLDNYNYLHEYKLNKGQSETLIFDKTYNFYRIVLINSNSNLLTSGDIICSYDISEVSNDYNLTAFNAHSSGSYPTASVGGYTDTYVGSSPSATVNSYEWVWGGTIDTLLVYGDYDFTDNVNIYLRDSSGNFVPDGIYRIDSDMLINCNFKNDGSNVGTFKFLGGYSEIVDSSLDIKYSLSGMGVPADNNYTYNIHISGDASVVNGFVGAINIKHYMTFAYHYYYSKPADSNHNGTPVYPNNTAFNINTLPFITYISGQPVINSLSVKPISELTTVFEGLDNINQSINNVDDTIQKQFQQDQQGATDAAQKAGSFITQAKDLENKWEILWYPITFSNNILSVFIGGTQSVAYQDTYSMIVGYEYDEDSGYLKPIINKSRASAKNSSGTIITWPAFTLPVFDVQLWDSYDFDLSTIKDGFPIVFNSLYVIVTILEVYWFVSFLRDKFEEVFG